MNRIGECSYINSKIAHNLFELFLLTIFIGSTLNSNSDIHYKMATKTYSKQKGHRVEKTQYHIPFNTKEFFEPEESTEDEGKKTPKVWQDRQ